MPGIELGQSWQARDISTAARHAAAGPLLPTCSVQALDAPPCAVR